MSKRLAGSLFTPVAESPASHLPWTEESVILMQGDSFSKGRKSLSGKADGVFGRHRGSRSVDLTGSRDWIESRKDKRWIGFNEFCGYPHGEVDVCNDGALAIRIRYDDHYCRHFTKRRSHWTLEFSDRYRKRLGRRISVDIDGKVEKRVLAARQTLTLPAGVGPRTVKIRPE